VLHLTKRGDYTLLDCDAEEKREGTSDLAAWLACVALGKWWKAVSNGG
jgi:hypothetical protein